ILALLHCIEAQLVDRSLFDDAIKVASEDDSNGPMWPLYLEWASNEWPQHNVIKKLIKNTVIDNMPQEKVRIFDASRLPRVFKGIEKADFTKVTRAIESNISLYEGRDEAEKEF